MEKLKTIDDVRKLNGINDIFIEELPTVMNVSGKTYVIYKDLVKLGFKFHHQGLYWSKHVTKKTETEKPKALKKSKPIKKKVKTAKKK